ncbi:fructose-6-phosphate aldolase [Enterococcus sp. AZ103]|uniref:fructose-6-phosphate aldolase n=1 Tax=Enterococcus sp. AZ103 TaxID=2774628 RepID=UPI003F24A74D
MEFMLDTTKLSLIEKYMKVAPIQGITSTPSIIKREGKINFFTHMKKTLELIGPERTLHMQVPAKNSEGMIADANTIWQEIDPTVYVKIPTTEAGFVAINYLKSQQRDCRITATAVYTKMQAFLALESKADYIAVYSNRSENIGVNPFDIIHSARKYVDSNHLKTKIMASSIKNVSQVTEAIDHGAHAVTFAPEILVSSFKLASVKQAVDEFTADWVDLYGEEWI